LDGLQNLASVRFSIGITSNDQLTDITALSPQTPVGSVSISDNQSLDQCRALAHVLTWPRPNSIYVAWNGPCADAVAGALR
jgi:hypothetical protein